MDQQHKQSDKFRWICLVLASGFGVIVLWQIHDLKSRVTTSLDNAKETVGKANETISTVNDRLPDILGEVKKGTETLSGLAEDVDLIKSVAGLDKQESKRGLRDIADYADAIQGVLRDSTEGRQATILIEEIFGSDLKEVESLDEFLVGLNKEMLAVILPLAKSKQEVLYRAAHSGLPRRKPFFIRIEEEEPQRLDDYIRACHPPSAELPAFKTE